MKLKNNVKGITLIALVVTIIALLILAGVAINLTIGQNGVISKAINAREENEKAGIIEQIRMDIADKQIESQGDINEYEFYGILNKYGTISSGGLMLTTNQGNYEIPISNIYDGNLVVDYTVKASSSTLDLQWDKNILSFSQNSNTQNYNIVWIDEDNIEFSKTTLAGASGYLVLGGTEEEYVCINLQTSVFLQTWKGNLQEINVVSTIISDRPEVQGIPLNRMKITKGNNGDVNISYKNSGNWIDYCTIPSSKIKSYISGEVRLGLMVKKEEVIGGTRAAQYAIYNDSYNSLGIFDKNVAFLGDSITNNLTYNYSVLLEKWCGFTKYNYGLGGSPISGNTSNSFVDRFTKKDSEYYTEVDKNVDIIFIFGGHNDGSDNVGTIEDSTQNTFYGSMRILIEYFQNNYPNAKIIFATPIKRNNESVNEVLGKKAEAMKSICKLYGIECIDLYSNSGITYENSSIYLADGIHPNTEGQKLIAEYLLTILRKITI